MLVFWEGYRYQFSKHFPESPAAFCDISSGGTWLSDPVVTGLARPCTKYILISDYDFKNANLQTLATGGIMHPPEKILVGLRLMISKDIRLGD